jgi:hypothetical protein
MTKRRARLFETVIFSPGLWAAIVSGICSIAVALIGT